MSNLDTGALLGALNHVAGLQFCGPVDAADAVELVFGAEGVNLVTIHASGEVTLGGVDDPEGYAARNRPQ